VIPTRHVTHIQKKSATREGGMEGGRAHTRGPKLLLLFASSSFSRPLLFHFRVTIFERKKTAGHRVIYSSLFEIRRVTRGKKSVATRTEISCFSICGSFLSSLSCFAHAPHGTSSTSPLMFRDYASLPYSGFVFVFRSFLPFLLVGRLYASSEASGLQRTKRRT